MTLPAIDAEAAYRGLKDALSATDLRGWNVAGIHTGGFWVAQRLVADLSLTRPAGGLDVGYYRDDFNRIGLHAAVHPTNLPFEVDDARILLVDDVLYTGRTLRAALQVLFDYGRPREVKLAVLIDRGGRQLPFAADFIGQTLAVAETSELSLCKYPTDGPIQTFSMDLIERVGVTSTHA